MKECFSCGGCFGDHNEMCDLDQTFLETTLIGLPLIKNRYRLDSRINTEATSITYLGYDLDKKCKVFIKVLLTKYLSIDTRLFFKEVETAAQIEDPNVIAVLSCGKKEDEFLYVVVEYVEGEFLNKVLDQSKTFTLDQIINYITSLCRAVDAVNCNDQILTDLKASNIIIDSNNDVKLLNTGIVNSAKLLDIKDNPNAMFDLPYYASPEQCLGKEIDERSEVYSIGVILYVMLAGDFPFIGQNYFAITEQHIRQTAKDPRILNPEIPDNIAAVVIRAIEKDPNRRFQSVLAFSSLLTQAFKQRNKTNLQKVSATRKPITEELPLANITPQELLAVHSSSYLSNTDEIDTNKTLEVTNLVSSAQPLENLQNLQPSVSSSLVGVKQSSNLTELTDRLKKVSGVKAIRLSSSLDSENRSGEFRTDNIKTDNIRVDNIKKPDLPISNIAEIANSLPVDLQDGTKPLPPELQAMFGIAPLPQSQESPAIPQSQIQTIPDQEEFTSKEVLDEVTKINDAIRIGPRISESTISTISPAATVYLFVDKFLTPSNRSSQYKRKMHNAFIVEREALASLLLVLAIFSLRRRKSLKILSLKNVPLVLQKKINLKEDEKIVFQLVNAAVKPLDQLEQSILKSLGKPNAISAYGLYKYFFEISDQQKIAVSELINDAVADDMVKRKVLNVVPRDIKIALEPGGSINSYSSNNEGLESYISQSDEVKRFIDELKKETIMDAYSNQIQLYDYMLDYYKNMFCEHSYTFDQ